MLTVPTTLQLLRCSARPLPPRARTANDGADRSPCQTGHRGVGPARAGDRRASGREARGRMIGRLVGGRQTWAGGGRGPAASLDRALLDDQDERGAAEPAQQRELHRALGAERADATSQTTRPRPRPRAPCSGGAGSRTASSRIRAPAGPAARGSGSRRRRTRGRRPPGMPRAIRVTEPTWPSSRSPRYIAVASPSRVGLVAMITSSNRSPVRLRLVDARQELADLEPLRADAVDGADGAVEHVVAAAELAGPLDGQHVERLLDHAQADVLAARVAADRAQGRVADVEAALAEHDLVADGDEGARERARLGVGARGAGGTSAAGRSWARSRAGGRTPR